MLQNQNYFHADMTSQVENSTPDLMWEVHKITKNMV